MMNQIQVICVFMKTYLDLGSELKTVEEPAIIGVLGVLGVFLLKARYGYVKNLLNAPHAVLLLDTFNHSALVNCQTSTSRSTSMARVPDRRAALGFKPATFQNFVS